jgi:hypothetical protein
MRALVPERLDREQSEAMVDSTYKSPLLTLRMGGATGEGFAIAVGEPRCLMTERREGLRREVWAFAGRPIYVAELGEETALWLVDQSLRTPGRIPSFYDVPPGLPGSTIATPPPERPERWKPTISDEVWSITGLPRP